MVTKYFFAVNKLQAKAEDDTIEQTKPKPLRVKPSISAKPKLNDQSDDSEVESTTEAETQEVNA